MHRNKLHWRKLSILILLIGFPAIAFSEQMEIGNPNDPAEGNPQSITRAYAIPSHGLLELSVPTEWSEKRQQPPGGLPPTILFQPKSGNEFKFLITTLWQEDPNAGLDQPDRLRAAMEQMGTLLMRRTAVETQLDLKEDTAGNLGYYFTLTDRAPKPGEFEYVTQGTFVVGDLLLSFTFLAHEKESTALKTGLDLLRNARHRKAA
ncbi:MAG: hypothetical protein AB1515_02880 [Nitrospirota bacterium]